MVGIAGIAQPPPGYQLGTGVPQWATEILEEVKHIRQKMQTVENTDKTVNIINAKVTDLENNVKVLEKRISENEAACKFISDSHDSAQDSLKSANDEIRSLKKMCQSLEENSNSLESEKNELLEKITKLEMRSMNDNLMFYGIPENEGEDCKQLIRDIWTEQLEMSVDDANGVRIVRAHRVGGKRRGANKPRPIVAKFFDPDQREQIRTLSFDHSDALKSADKGIGVQWPKVIRDRRRELIPTMTRLRKDPLYKNKDVKLVVDKLLVDGREYKGTRAPATRETRTRNTAEDME
jgi:cell division protein FtsB